MIKDKESVREKLRKAVLQGHKPYYEYESACDHGADWTVLSEEEFDHIIQMATREREQKAQE